MLQQLSYQLRKYPNKRIAIQIYEIDEKIGGPIPYCLVTTNLPEEIIIITNQLVILIHNYNMMDMREDTIVKYYNLC